VKDKPKNIGASVRARLLRIAQEREEDFQLVLARYANERLLYRLAMSPHGSAFVLKGAALFTLWTDRAYRATRDVDLLGLGDGSEQRLRAVFEEVLGLDVPADGVVFDVGSTEVGPIREDQAYGGVRIVIIAKIVNARIRLQVDVGLGDAITPDPELVTFPPLLDFPAPRIRVYPRETVIAEKLEAMVQLRATLAALDDAQVAAASGVASPFVGPCSASEKVALFRQLFRGRDDLYPTRFVSKKTGKPGYAPACSNKWVPGLCVLKTGGKCSDCTNQAFLPVDEAALLLHLRGKHVMGIYPLLADETCWFLAADFDKTSWKEDVQRTLQHLLPWTDLDPTSRGCWACPVYDLLEEHRDLLPFEGHRVREHLGEHQTHAVHVGPGTRPTLTDLLGRGIRWRERDLIGPRTRVTRTGRLVGAHEFGDAEVEQFRRRTDGGLHDHDVRGLDVSVRDPLLVNKSQGGEHGPQNGQAVRGGAAPLTATLGELVLQGHTGEPLERHPGRLHPGWHRRHAEVEHLDDARMRDPGDSLGLGGEAREKLLSLGVVEALWRLQDLQRNRTLEGRLLCVVDHTKSPLSNHTVDDEAPLESRPHEAKDVLDGRFGHQGS
jgi:Nucleotidyl transferase AbiEii toxin, Type IV TA system